MNENAAAGPYPPTRKITITVGGNPKKVLVSPDPAKVRKGGMLEFRVAPGIKSFKVTMTDSKRTPFASGKPDTSGGKNGKDEKVGEDASSGDSDAKNTYSYEVTCTTDDGEELDMDPDIIVGPPTT